MAGLQIFYNSSWNVTGAQDSYWDVLTATPLSQTVNLSWPSAGGSPTSYELSVNDVVQNVGNVTSFSPTGLSFGVSYQFKVRPVFSDGSTGGWSFFKSSSPSGLNEATGGTETTISNYNGTGQTWKVHTFTSSGSLNVVSALQTFSVLTVGGGGGGKPWIPSDSYGGGGGGGGLVANTAVTLTTGAKTVVVGNGGGSNGGVGGSSSFDGLYTSGGGGAGNTFGVSGGTSGSPQSRSGGSTSAQPAYSLGGGGGGAGGNGGNASAGAGGSAGAGLANTISGASIIYAPGGRGTYGGQTTGITPANLGSGGESGAAGRSGIVIVAYRIA